MNILRENIEVHDTLNPNIWNGDELRPEVRTKILEIVNYFVDNFEIPIEPVDIYLLGSNASYNYTDNSDLDVHIIVNFDMVDTNKELVQAYMNSEKTRFNKNYDITIHDVPIEVYVEDVNAATISNGIYSMFEDEWVKYPEPLSKEIPEIDLEPELTELTQEVNQCLQVGDAEDVDEIINKLYIIRKTGLQTDGEYGKGNQLFKEIRNLGLLDALKDKRMELQADKLSLERFERGKVFRNFDNSDLQYVDEYKGFEILDMPLTCKYGDNEWDTHYYFVSNGRNLYSPTEENLLSIDDCKEYIDNLINWEV